ncbi:MAG: methyltransferase domain-containing protein [Nanoarchaeota archaeon]|nr:methyltransferase domain-containing protein [Nanoarchaeota archaeon]
MNSEVEKTRKKWLAQLEPRIKGIETEEEQEAKKNFFTYQIYKLNKKVSGNRALRNILVKTVKYSNPFDRKMRVDIGGGSFLRPGWKVLDYISDWYHYGSVYIDYNFDLTSGRRLPFRSDSVDMFYSSHTIEHLPEKDARFLFKEIYRTLKKGGVFRVTCPDFDVAYEGYKKKDLSYFFDRENTFERRLIDFFATYLVGKVDDKEIEKNFKKMEKEEFADYYVSKIPKNLKMVWLHSSWWSHDKVICELRKAGFKRAYESEPHKSRFREFRKKKMLFINGFDEKFHRWSLFVECVK